MDGWIKLHRSLLDWEWFNEPDTLLVFIYLLLTARHDKGNWRGTEILAGQCITSRDKISLATGLSERKVRTSLARLENTHEIEVKSSNKFSIVTICNYDRYQTQDDIERPAECPTNDPQNDQQTSRRTTSKRPTNKQERKNIKNEENNININNISSDQEFVDYIYNLYPSKCPKRGASLGKCSKNKDAILRLMKKYTREQIESGVKKEINERYGKQYMRNFSTFLNNFPDPNILTFDETPADNDDIMLQKMYSIIEPEKEAEIYGLVPYEFSMLPENAKKAYRESNRAKMLKWIKDNQ